MITGRRTPWAILLRCLCRCWRSIPCLRLLPSIFLNTRAIGTCIHSQLEYCTSCECSAYLNQLPSLNVVFHRTHSVIISLFSGILSPWQKWRSLHPVREYTSLTLRWLSISRQSTPQINAPRQASPSEALSQTLKHIVALMLRSLILERPTAPSS